MADTEKKKPKTALIKHRKPVVEEETQPEKKRVVVVKKKRVVRKKQRVVVKAERPPQAEERVQEVEKTSAAAVDTPPVAPGQLAATAEHDLRPLSDDIDAGEGYDLLPDILAESPLAVPLMGRVG